MNKFPYHQDLLTSALTYQAYREGIDHTLLHNSKPDTYGKYADYTQNNIGIMDGYDQSAVISPALKEALAVAPRTTWLVLTEGWCGDAAFSTPLLAKLGEVSPDHVQVRFLLRDEHPDLMNAHLTNGGQSIPIVIVLNEKLEELAKWGPRPVPLQALMADWKAAGLSLPKIIPKVRAWYDEDNTQTLQNELLALVKSYSSAG